MACFAAVSSSHTEPAAQPILAGDPSTVTISEPTSFVNRSGPVSRELSILHLLTWAKLGSRGIIADLFV